MPEPIDREPVDPELEVPELNTKRPDVPPVPESALRIVIAPLVDPALMPVTAEI
jgi:hypothetical protein